jgi:hypothetical protein
MMKRNVFYRNAVAPILRPITGIRSTFSLPVRKAFIPVIFCFFASCGYPPEVENALQCAGDNRSELEKVLEHYSQPDDKLKYKTACFLIANMPEHEFCAGEAIDAYRDGLLSMDSIDVRTSGVLDSIWHSVEHAPVSRAVRHVTSIKADYLIPEIDEAFNSWEQAPWKDSISFDMFLHYIAPYCVDNEPLVRSRKMLRDKYYPVIAGITSPKQAFDALYAHIVRNFTLGGFAFPYTMDAVMIDRSMRGLCDERALYIVSVARSLGIPAAFDCVTAWANYSTSGHAWASHVGTDGAVYTFPDDDSVSHRNGLTDVTAFKLGFPFDDSSTMYHIDPEKRFSKIWRRTYELHKRKEIDYNHPVNSRYFNIHALDVSDQYNTGVLKIALDKYSNETVYLCTFLTGKGWIPADAAKPHFNSVQFKHVGSPVAYLAARIKNGGFVPVCNPVTLYPDGSQRLLNPDNSRNEHIILRRKYLLHTAWIYRWHRALGSKFELSETEDFTDSTKMETVHRISDIPIGIINVDTKPSQSYRYARFITPRGQRPYMAELAFYTTAETGEKQELTGKIYGKGIDGENMPLIFDKKILTKPYTRGQYWVAMDFGQPQNVTSIEYCFWNDANFIEKGHEYELFYFDMEWKSLGRKVADRNFLEYYDVPQNALFWLRDRTEGREERIFTYENGKQIWW